MARALRDPEVVKRLTDRLRRIEGQARGIQRMLEEGRPCDEVITQLCALRNAVNKVAAQVIVENLEACILQDDPEMDPKEALQEAKRLFLRL
ncbi:MAG: metal-sensitive transcriptional regulator [Bacillota bacterium]